MSHPPSTARAGRSTEEIAAARLVRRVVSQWPLILACALVAAVAGYLASSARTDQFEATTTIQLNEVDLSSVFLNQNLQQQGQDAEAKTATNAKLVKLPRVREMAAAKLGGGITAADLDSAVTVTPEASTTLVQISARDPEPARAAAIADEMRKAFITTRAEVAAKQFTNAERDISNQLDELSSAERSSEATQLLRDRLQQVRTLRVVSNGGIETVQQATVPTAPVAPKPKRDAILALLAGGLLGLGVALLRARLDDRVRDADELTELWELPVIGLVPERDELAKPGHDLPDGASLEAFALARTNLRYLHVGGEIKTVVITSAIPAEGKSTVAWNLALAAAMAGSKVLLVEGDLRAPVLAGRLQIPVEHGFSEVLAGLSTVEESIVSVNVGEGSVAIAGSVDVLPAGMTPPSPIALLERPATKTLFEGLAADYDIIFIDTPPATAVADAMVLMDVADGALVVARLGRSTRESVERLREVLGGHDTPVLGQIVNGGAGGAGAAYGYGYGYGATKPAPAVS